MYEETRLIMRSVMIAISIMQMYKISAHKPVFVLVQTTYLLYDFNMILPYWEETDMQLAEVLKLKLNTDPDMDKAFENTSYQYMLACDYISRYVFEHEFQINSAALSKELYRDQL